MARALVIGGTGPTGPCVVDGLLDRGFEVTILHSGQHEASFAGPVEHIHVDPHFPEQLELGLEGRTFDVAVASYGRLRHTCEALAGKVGQLVCISGTGGYAARDAESWGGLGMPLMADETGPWEHDPDVSKIHYLMHLSEERVLELHREGAFSATIVRPATMYGPRQPAPQEWSVVRRFLDGRRRIVIADGGLKAHARAFSENVAAAILLVVDRAGAAAGKRFNVRDRQVYTNRQWIERIAATLGWTPELVDMPYDLAWPCHPFWMHDRNHRTVSDAKIRSDLGHEDAVATDAALALTVRALLAAPPERGGEAEQQLGDPFAYDDEDLLVSAWEGVRGSVENRRLELPAPAHRYRHPQTPGEPWKRPTGASLRIDQ